MKKLLTICLVTLIIMTVVTQSGIAEYIYEPFDYSDATGDKETIITDINNAGNIAGVYTYGVNADGDYYPDWHGFFYDGVSYTSIDVPVPGAYETFIEGINDDNKIVGYYKDDTLSRKRHGFLYDGTYTTIDCSGAYETILSGINDAGKILGRFYSFYPVRRVYPFLWDGTMCSIIADNEFEDCSVDIVSVCTGGINNADKIVGVYKVSIDEDNDGLKDWHGFLKDGTTCTTYDVNSNPIMFRMEAFDINDADNIVGVDDVGFFGAYGYVYNGNSFTNKEIGYPNYCNGAHGINNAGKITGTYVKDLLCNKCNGNEEDDIVNCNPIWEYHGFIATCSNPPARINTTFEDSSLQNTYNAALDGDIIYTQSIVFTEDLYIDGSKSVFLRAGYDCDYISSTGKTVLKGNLIIIKGKLTIESGTFEVM